MGDVQEYFIEKGVRNFYSVSISGYHIAEAGANPITQLAFTLANGFTYVEYYLSRGMNINDFGPNLSFFFSPTLSQAGGGPAVGWLRVVRLGGGHGILQPAAASRLPLRVRKGPLLRHESATSLHIFAPTLHQRRPTQGLH